MKDNITIGEKYNPAMKITDQAEADKYFEDCVQHTMRVANKSKKEAVKIEKQNIGYYAGYFDDETRERVYKLFNTKHPILPI